MVFTTVSYVLFLFAFVKYCVVLYFIVFFFSLFKEDGIDLSRCNCYVIQYKMPTYEGLGLEKNSNFCKSLWIVLNDL